MTSKDAQAFVWIWLPQQVKPVVCGKLQRDNGNIVFNYGQSYLEKIQDQPPAMAIYEPELPLQRGILPLFNGLKIPNCIRDAAPDAWGRRVILNKLTGTKTQYPDTHVIHELTYLLESGSDRIGAMDFQHSPTNYIPRLTEQATLEELMQSAQRIEAGLPLSPELDQALLHGSSIGGARPKALIYHCDQNKKYIAKFSSTSDSYPVIKGEFIAMRLAALVGLHVANVTLHKSLNKDVLVIERFDRVLTKKGWTRRAMISSLTLFGLDEMMARYASYEEFSEIIRKKFKNPKKTLKELFCRLVFNVLCGNTDDHARNHAAFYENKQLTLTPAYDICPQPRSGNEVSQAMLITGNNNLSQLKTCLQAAHHFLLTPKEALHIFEEQVEIIENNWELICDEAQLSESEKKFFWRRQFLNPFSIIIK